MKKVWVFDPGRGGGRREGALRGHGRLKGKVLPETLGEGGREVCELLPSLKRRREGKKRLLALLGKEKVCRAHPWVQEGKKKRASKSDFCLCPRGEKEGKKKKKGTPGIH